MKYEWYQLKNISFTIGTTLYDTAEKNPVILYILWCQVKLYTFFPINVIFHVILYVLDLRCESLNKIYQTET
jgi:hypothetical protein